MSAKVRDVFARFDLNHDRKIDLSELSSVLKELDDYWNDDNVEQVFDAADVNKDGAIFFGEFVSWVFAEGDHQHEVRRSAGIVKRKKHCKFGAKCRDFWDESHCMEFDHPPACKFGIDCRDIDDAEHQCKFWHPRLCRDGAGCKQLDDELHCKMFGHPRAKDLARLPGQCKFWKPQLRSGCPEGDSCEFKHLEPSDEICKHFVTGGCGAGELCPFRHEKPWDTKEQKALGAQSLRGVTGDMAGGDSFGSAIDAHEHAKSCFTQMVQRERHYAGDWCVFYHSYSQAAFMYEVSAAIAHVLFRFQSKFAALPRLLRHHFRDIPDADAMMKRFPSWPDQDHNIEFKRVGICCSTSLISKDPEATPTHYFLKGYAVSSVPLEILMGFLKDCGVTDEGTQRSLAESIVAESSKWGLSSPPSGLTGHLIQIFVHRSVVDKVCYSALPYGVPDPTRHPIGDHLLKDCKIQGQVRMVVNPRWFLSSKQVRIYTYSADQSFHENRHAYHKALRELLDPILGEHEARVAAATGIYDGKLPSWWHDDATIK